MDVDRPLLVIAGVEAEARSVRLRFLLLFVAVRVVAGLTGTDGMAAAEAPEPPERAEFVASFRNCAPVSPAIPRRTFVHEGPDGLLVASNTNEAPCVRDEFLSCDLEILDCRPASPAVRDRILTADMPPAWPGPGSWVSL